MATCALILLPSFAAAQPAPLEGPALHRALEGVWCNSHDGGRSCWAYDEFSADGRFEACGRTEDDPRPFRGSGTVTVTGQRMCYVVATASSNFWLPLSSRYCTDIVSIGPDTHRYRDIDTGAVFTLYRRPRSEKQCR